MLSYHRNAWNSFAKYRSGLCVFAKGLDSFELVKQLVIDLSQRGQKAFAFGLSDNQKIRIILECQNLGVESLPKDIEKNTGKQERAQLYQSNAVFFHSAGMLGKDFLTGLIDPESIPCLIVMHAESIHKDPGLQLCLSYFGSKNPHGCIRAFSENINGVSDLQLSMTKLWTPHVLLFPRFEGHVTESIHKIEPSIKYIRISLREEEIEMENQNRTDFCAIVSHTLSQLFWLLKGLLEDFVKDRGKKLSVDVDDCLFLHRMALENRAVTDEQKKVLECIVFLRRAFFLLLHDNPMSFHNFLVNNRPNISERQLLVTYRQLSSIYSVETKYVHEKTPSPKLQWILHLIRELPKDKRILVLTDAPETVNLINEFLADFVSESNSIGTVEDNRVVVDREFCFPLTAPIVMVQELDAEENVLERYLPDFVIYWGVSLMALRRLEVFISRYQKNVVPYLLIYDDAKELVAFSREKDHEMRAFQSCIESLRTLPIIPNRPLPPMSRIIIADEREFRSHLPLELLEAGFKVVPEVLTVGDYVLADDMVVERKAYADLLASLKSGRLAQQIQRMTNTYQKWSKVILLLEFSGTEFNSVSASDKSAMVMDKLAVMIRCFPNLRIVWARNNTEAAKCLMQLAQGKENPDLEKAVAMGNITGMSNNTRSWNFLSAIPFLTQDQIVKLMAFRTLDQLASASRKELEKVIGELVARKLYWLLHKSLI